MRRILAAIFVAAMCMAWVHVAHAQQNKKPPTYEAQVQNAVLRPRTGAPLVVDIKIINRAKSLLRGPLHLRLSEGPLMRAMVTTPEVVAPPGESMHRVTLPPMEVMHNEETISMTIEMWTAQEAVDLGVAALLAPVSTERSLVIGVVDPLGRSGGRHGELLRTLLLEQYRPTNEPGGGGVAMRDLSTTPTGLEPERMPLDPLALTPYDMMMITPEGLSQMGRSQLEALSAWLRAGGSAVIITGGGLGAAHVDFLNATLGAEAGEQRYLLDAEGKLTLMPRMPSTGFALHHTALGRLVVVFEGADAATLASDDWMRAVAHLWKIRANQIESLIDTGKWDPKKEEKPPQPEYSYNRYQAMQSGESIFRIHPLPTSGSSQLLPALMPPSVQVVPFWVVVVILVVFALAVGPGDYLVLGALKQRKLTWVVFPAIALAFTLVTVVVADRYMGRTDHRRALEIVDLDSVGFELRRTRIELLFTAKQRDMATELAGKLIAPLSTSRLADESGYYGYPGVGPMYGNDADDMGRPMVIDGRLPSRYVFSQRVPQWTAQINRITTIPTERRKPAEDLNWDDVAVVDATMSIRAELQGPSTGEVGVMVYTGMSEKMEVDEYASARFPKADQLQAFLRAVTSRQREGFFSIVSQISPTGSESFEDLAIIDRANDGQPLIAAIRVEGDNIVMYRRLYPRAAAGEETP